MKYIYTISVLLMLTISGYGQVHSLSENFDVTCAAGTVVYPGGWLEYNDLPPTDSMNWKCTATLGRSGTPGMRCLGYYSGAYHLDTAWLFTPALILPSTLYPASAYLRFDSKYEVGYPVGVHKSTLNALLMYTFDSSFTILPAADSAVDLTTTLAPVIGPGDSTGWVTHQLNLSSFIGYSTPIRVAFRYISTDVDAGAWTLDNIMTSPVTLFEPELPGNPTNITFSGTISDNIVSITYRCPANGDYNVILWDLAGRRLLKQDIPLHQGDGTFSLPCSDLTPGLYLLEITNGQYRKVERVVRY